MTPASVVQRMCRF